MGCLPLVSKCGQSVVKALGLLFRPAAVQVRLLAGGCADCWRLWQLRFMNSADKFDRSIATVQVGLQELAALTSCHAVTAVQFGDVGFCAVPALRMVGTHIDIGKAHHPSIIANYRFQILINHLRYVRLLSCRTKTTSVAS